MTRENPLTILGAGICGCLLSIRLTQRGYHVVIYERRHDYRMREDADGISINLALSARGIRAIEEVGDEELLKDVLAMMIPMYGRIVHDLDGSTHIQPYSKDGNSHIDSISRNDLNNILLDYAEKLGVKIHFNSKVEKVDHRKKVLIVNGEKVDFEVCFGTDGAKSIARMSMINMPMFNYSQQYSQHGYKEIIMPADESGDFKINKNGLHLWPRGKYMLIGLPNIDGSYTCTLFMPNDMFSELDTEEKVSEFFQENYPDMCDLCPNLIDHYFRNPTGRLMTIRCFPWSTSGRLLILGDAAHAIVPFFGQGLNCAMEDVTVLFDTIDTIGLDNGWTEVFETFEKIRNVDSNRIADMAIENYLEMRDTVNDPMFKFRKNVIHYLGRSFPDMFNSRYESVSFTSMRYSTAYRKGELIQEIVTELTDGMSNDADPESIDLELAKKLIEEKLVPLENENGSVVR